ncbi:hypothetical protein WJX75_007249 [Coccomyxa subellipsoidea]|uniref:PCI domain-containing protein n=1 Tax=Coccomyxa subellipsoidea TaxID=248742 RepID=A0ABR2YJZ7_9CHLO
MTTAGGDDAPGVQDPRITLANKCFSYRASGKTQKEKAKIQQEILESIFQDDAAPLYETVCKDLGWTADTGRVAAMKSANEAELVKLEASIKDAEENLGDIEVRDAYLAKADYLYKIGDREAAMAAYQQTEGKTAGVGQKMDLAFSMLRLDIAAGDWHAVKAGLKAAAELCENGGDWERKNRLKVYDATFRLATRDLAGAAGLLLDSIATFTSTELFSYETCIFYTVLTAIPTLDRVSLKEKVVDAPEILTVIDTIPNLSTFLNALYECRYADFFKAFAGIADQTREDVYLHPHVRYYVREVRVVAYSQFLDSYKSVTLESMASAFGVSVDFIDYELVDFIVAGRLPAKIDRVAGVIETKRPDAKNAQYQAAIKQGDLLLNRLQKLSKVIDDSF